MTADEGKHRPGRPAGRTETRVTTPGDAWGLAGIQPEHLYKAIGLFFLLLVLYSFFDAITRVLLIVFASAILAVALNVLVSLVPSHRRVMSALLGLLIFGAIGATLYFAIPALASQLRGLTGEVPQFQQQLESWGEWLRQTTGLNVSLVSDQTQEYLGNAFGNTEILGSAMSIVEGIFLPLVIIIGSIYAVARPNERLLNPVLRAVPKDRRDSFRHLFALLGSRLKGWVKGTLISIVVVGLLTGGGLFLIGVEYALLLGVAAGFLEIVPIIGPWVAGTVAVGVALIDDPTKAMWVAGLMLLIQQLESNVITPVVMSKAAEVHPFVTLFALFLFGSIFGFLGILLAVPIVLLIWTVLEVLWVGRAIEAGTDTIEPVVEE